MRRSGLVLVLAVTLLVAACSAGSEGGSRAGPGTTAEAPATTVVTSNRGLGVAQPVAAAPSAAGRGAPFLAMPKALADRYGYVEEELFLSGTATSYREAGPWGTDGVWGVTPATTAPYVMRVLVRRPADRAKFDGTAVVEWLNVTSGRDNDVVFAHAHEELLAHGTVWVGVSAQKVGVEGGGAAMTVPGVEATPLKTWDPERYGALVHPGDDYSYDMFSQAAAAILRPDGADLLGGGRVRALIAAGESQAAARMVTYINAIQPVAAIYDGFFVHSRSMGGAILHAATPERPPFAHIRTDLDVPVFQFETETDLFGLPFIEARQPDTDRLRTWEVAGTAHLDQSLLDYGQARAGSAPAGAGAGGDPVAASCGSINRGPQSAVVRKAMEGLRTWVLQGTPPAAGPPLDTADGQVVRDEHGIARGGVRTPPVDAPTEVLRGDTPVDRGYLCSLFGSTTPLDPATLARLYPDHEAYVAAVTRAAESAVGRGHLREVDGRAMIDAAQLSTIGR